MSIKDKIAEKIRRLEDLDISREEFFDMLAWTSDSRGEGVNDLLGVMLGRIYAHPSLPTDMLAHRMKVGHLEAWLNPSAELAQLSDPDVEAFDRGLCRAALIEITGRVFEVAAPIDQILQALNGRRSEVACNATPFFVRWRQRLLALIDDYRRRYGLVRHRTLGGQVTP